MKKVKESCRPFLEIPSALLWEILGKLPVKTCLTSSRFTMFFQEFGDGGTFKLVELEKAFEFDDFGYCVVGVDDMIRGGSRIFGPWGPKFSYL
ncbi:unnamed protein product [Cuscuta campestris]|uniref:Uncharacterized protein n=1 Tax=Cuscuta campestris TaxID=132261 RepID=A0A484MEX8_9ASTE|nr:unnamed protein product [Cuscuta campestris]